MPIPAAADGSGEANAVLTLFQQLHQQIRDEVAELDDEALRWAPTSGANSVAIIVNHLVGSEAETLRSVAGLPCERDRAAEFERSDLTKAELLALLAEADDLLATVEDLIDAECLKAAIALPTMPASEVRPAMTWLINNYGHGREHLGHIQLTRQLVERKAAAGS